MVDRYSSRSVLLSSYPCSDRTNENGLEREDMEFLDLFVANYEAEASVEDVDGEGGAATATATTMDKLTPHRDGSLLSLTILLSPPSEFEGGGTVPPSTPWPTTATSARITTTSSSYTATTTNTTTMITTTATMRIITIPYESYIREDAYVLPERGTVPYTAAN